MDDLLVDPFSYPTSAAAEQDDEGHENAFIDSQHAVDDIYHCSSSRLCFAANEHSDSYDIYSTYLATFIATKADACNPSPGKRPREDCSTPQSAQYLLLPWVNESSPPQASPNKENSKHTRSLPPKTNNRPHPKNRPKKYHMMTSGQMLGPGIEPGSGRGCRFLTKEGPHWWHNALGLGHFRMWSLTADRGKTLGGLIGVERTYTTHSTIIPAKLMDRVLCSRTIYIQAVYCLVRADVETYRFIFHFASRILRQILTITWLDEFRSCNVIINIYTKRDRSITYTEHWMYKKVDST